jgi:hypothetical protein
MGRSRCRPRPPVEAHIVLETTPQIFAEQLDGSVTIASAVTCGRAVLEGPAQEAVRFFEVFWLPGREPASR